MQILKNQKEKGSFLKPDRNIIYDSLLVVQKMLIGLFTIIFLVSLLEIYFVIILDFYS